MKKSLVALGALGGVLAGAYYGFNEWVYRALIYADFQVPKSLSKKVSENESADYSEDSERCKKWLEDYGYKKYNMINADGNMLVAYHLQPKKKSNVYVFGSHGYRSDGKGEWCFFAKHYVEELGYNFFFVDHQGAGESTGQYVGFSSFESRDSLQWLEFMNKKFGSDIQIILHGISMGSATVMLMTGSKKLPDNVKFTIADCGFTSALDEFTYKLTNLGVPTKPIIPHIVNKNLRRAGYHFQHDTNALGAVQYAKVPMLFIHGDKDAFVPTYMVHQLYDNCGAPYKDKLIVEGADHAESYHLAPEKYEKKIDEFIEMFVG